MMTINSSPCNIVTQTNQLEVRFDFLQYKLRRSDSGLARELAIKIADIKCVMHVILYIYIYIEHYKEHI